MTTPKPYPEVDSLSATLPNKVSEEAAAPYLTRAEFERKTSYRQPAPRFIAGLPASDEVWNFAQEHALAPHVETAVRLAREHFKGIRNIRLDHLIDPEIPNREVLEIHLHATGLMEELLQADQSYIRAINAVIPTAIDDKICTLLWGDAKDLQTT